MNFIDRIAERLQVSAWVVWLGLAALAIAIVIVIRRLTGAGSTAGVSSNSAGDVLNGPFSSGNPGTSANPLPTAPDGGADSGSTPAPTANPPTAGTPLVSSKTYVHPSTWPTKNSTLSGIASSYGIPLSTIESFPENQYIKQRSGWGLIYTSDNIRIK